MIAAVGSHLGTIKQIIDLASKAGMGAFEQSIRKFIAEVED